MSIQCDSCGCLWYPVGGELVADTLGGMLAHQERCAELSAEPIPDEMAEPIPDGNCPDCECCPREHCDRSHCAGAGCPCTEW